MSASIFWRPVNFGNQLRIGAPSSFIDSLERTFGIRPPIRLESERDACILDGMAAATEYKEFREAYQQLATAIRQDEGNGIEIFANY
jgi:hypothetical protein